MGSERKVGDRGAFGSLPRCVRSSRPSTSVLARPARLDSSAIPARGLSKLLRYVWAAPSSCLGLALALAVASGGGTRRRVDGVLEVEGPWLAWLLRRGTLPAPGVEALTLGHVVLGRDRRCLERCRDHERVHVAQYERWGPLFLPAYLLASLWLVATGRDPYGDNPFERQAFAAAPIEAR